MRLDKDPFSHVNVAQADFAGIPSHLSLNSSTTELLGQGVWIIDIGASNHMCNNLNFFNGLSHIDPPISLHLPGGHPQYVIYSGPVCLHPHMHLIDVLFLPFFKYNLISVSRLSASAAITFIFTSSHCILKDQKTNSILVVGKLIGSLYVLDESSFSSSIPTLFFF